MKAVETVEDDETVNMLEDEVEHNPLISCGLSPQSMHMRKNYFNPKVLVMENDGLWTRCLPNQYPNINQVSGR
jgi:hypothetical protein